MTGQELMNFIQKYDLKDYHMYSFNCLGVYPEEGDDIELTESEIFINRENKTVGLGTYSKNPSLINI